MHGEAVINAHSHTPQPGSVVSWDILNRENVIPIMSDDIFYSTGIHPWHADAISQGEVHSLLCSLIETLKPVAIGECGLDRVCKTPFNKQVEIFIEQLKFANEYNLPVVVHAVRSWSDLFPLFSRFKKLRFILHDYRANVQQTKKLLEFDTFFSFGKSLEKPIQKMAEVMLMIPKERILIETDDSSTTIDEVLERICVVLQIEKEAFRRQLIANTRNAFRL
jgi:TatD DNase family protein